MKPELKHRVDVKLPAFNRCGCVWLTFEKSRSIDPKQDVRRR
jgi:hypothetical protein